jgi:TatD DNase family protein
MDHPEPGDFIDIHTHGTKPADGVFSIENIMAHENRLPVRIPGLTFTAGIHPWHLTEDNQKDMVDYIRSIAGNENIKAIGEAGFDKLRGPSMDLQRTVFGEQVVIAKEIGKPMVIHCVRSWDELLSSHRIMKPELPWLVHGFRGKKELAMQLINRGMYLSFWFDFVLRPESTALLGSLPKERIFLETDGADVSIKDIYEKVAGDLKMAEEELKAVVYSNYKEFFKS